MCTACACGTEPAQAETSTANSADSADGKVYAVSGMTCGHCVSSVSAEIDKVGGVTGVAVDLRAGVVTVSGSGFTDEEIRTAVQRAGYSM